MTGACDPNHSSVGLTNHAVYAAGTTAALCIRNDSRQYISDKQQRLWCGSRRGNLQGVALRFERSEWEQDLERTPLAHDAGHIDAAVMVLDDAARQRESKSGPVAARRKEGTEYVA